MSDKGQEYRIWQTKFYNLQREAPEPHVVPCTRTLPRRPPQYGIEYHGAITRQETDKLLENAPDGAYLIRDSQRAEGAYTLVIWFDKVAKNFILYYDPVNKQHYVGENRFDTIELLVADGLIHFYVETRGAEVLKKIADANTYETTPFYKMRYHTFNASALNNTLDQAFMKTKPATLTAKGATLIEGNGHRLERRVSPPTTKPPVTPSSPTNKSQSMLLRRQSIDAAQLARKQALPSTQDDLSTPKDRTTVNDKVSDQNSETWRYREWPPNADHGESRRFSSTAEVPIPPPRRMSASGGILRQPPSSIVSALRSDALINAGSGDSRSSSRLVHTQSNVASSQTNVPGKLTHIPEDTDPACTMPTSLDHKTTIPFASLTSSTGSHELDSSDSFTSNTTATSSSYSSNLSPTDTSNSSSALDGKSATGATDADCAQPTNVSNADSVSWRNGTKIVNETAGKNAMLTLQERYNLPAVCFADPMQLIENSKPHNFKVHTFRGPHWCDYCTHFIWGLVAQGFKCTDCGFQAHKRCSDRVPCDCLPDIKQLKRVFGVDLTSLTRAERKNVPTILVRCVDEIERRGALACEGLYRIPGNHDRVDQMRAAFDKDSESADISESRIADVNVITSLIKSFLRQLPVPLITYEAYYDLIDVTRNEQLTNEERLKAIRNLLIRLPPAHYESLRFFMQHIHRVAELSDVNMMSAENLAIVLSPSLMTSSYSDPISCIAGTRWEHALVERMIKDFDLLFPAMDTPTRRAATNENRPQASGADETSKRNSQINATPVSPGPTLSQAGFVKRKFMRNRRSVDTPLLAAVTAAASNPSARSTASENTSPAPLSTTTTVQYTMNTAL